jgi:hypothetical protein
MEPGTWCAQRPCVTSACCVPGDDDSAKEYNSKSPNGMVSHGTDMGDGFKVISSFRTAAQWPTKSAHTLNSQHWGLRSSAHCAMRTGTEEGITLDEAEKHRQVMTGVPDKPEVCPARPYRAHAKSTIWRHIELLRLPRTLQDSLVK